MAPLGVMSVNVNGVRAAARKGGIAWIGEQLRSGRVAVACLQEVRATNNQLQEVLVELGLDGLHVATDESTRLGHSGVAMLSTKPLSGVKAGVGPKDFAGTGRWVQGTIETASGPLTVASVYVFAGDIEKPVQQEKYKFLDAMTKWFKSAQTKAAAGEGHFLACGDFNVGHTKLDIKNWKGNVGKAGFHPDEQRRMDEWFNEVGVVDLGRKFAGEVEGPYTWWSNRGQAFDTNTGWRIDYHVSTSGLAEKLAEVKIDKADSYAERWSDHAPITATFKL